MKQHILINATCILFLFACWNGIVSGIDTEMFFKNIRDKYEKVNSYSCTMEIYEKLGEKTEERTLRFYFKKPDLIRAEVTKGRDSGGVAIFKNNYV